MAASIVVLIGAGQQEAFAELQTWTWGLYGLAYLVMFAIPLSSRKELGLRPGLGVRVAAVSGFLVTLLFLMLAVFPIIPVESRGQYEAKALAGILGANLAGWAFYYLGRRNQKTT